MELAIDVTVRQKLSEKDLRIVREPKEIDLGELDSFVSGQSTGNFFQSPQYYSFYRSLKGYETLLLCAYDQNNQIVGSVVCIINRLIWGSKIDFLTRAIVMGGPVVRDSLEDKQTVADLLIRELIIAARKKSVYLEFRNLFDISSYRKAFENNNLAYHDHLNFLINSSDRASVMANLNKSKQQQIRKSLAAGAEICVAKNIDEVAQFYRHLVRLYKTKVKKPLPKWEFFEQFFRQKENLGLYIVVKFENRVVGGMMCPVFANRIIYDWYVAGEDRVYKNIYPSVLVTWGAIEYAVNNNIPCYDFLGAGKPKHEYGVREFKAQFGGELKNFGRYARILSPSKYNFSQWLLKKFGYFK